MDLQVRTRAAGDRIIVQPEGEIDLATAPRLREQLLDAIRVGQHHLIVDLEHVHFMDVSVLNALLAARQQATESGGSLRLVCTHPRQLKILQLTGLCTVFPIHDSTEDAAAA